LTARLAPSRPMLHAMILGGIGVVLSILGAVAMWDPAFAWYPIALAASALPSAWLGARLVTFSAPSSTARSKRTPHRLFGCGRASSGILKRRTLHLVPRKGMLAA